MKIFPAIDIKDKKCVRLIKGDFENKTEYETSPIDQAGKYKDHGFKNLHIVDLDGALTGKTVNLNIIKDMKKSFKNCIIGYSSHHNGISTELIAYTLGARIFEKHFTLNRSWKGTDQSFSLEFSGMSKLVRDLNRIDEALGSGEKKFLKSENQAIFKLSKSLYTSRELMKGEKLTYEDIEVKCPGGGLNSFDIEKIVGKKIKKNLKYEHLIKITDFER